MKCLMTLLAIAILSSSCQKEVKETDKDIPSYQFNPKPLDDDWSKWIVGHWEGSGESSAGKGKIHSTIELGLNGQFLIMTGEAEITEISADYLKKNMHASDKEIQRFQSMPYRGMEIHTIDQITGESVGYMFDSLRCIAIGRGKRQANKEIMEWQWQTGHKSTRITEKASNNKMVVIERTLMPDGSIMEDRGEMIRSNNSGK